MCLYFVVIIVVVSVRICYNEAWFGKLVDKLKCECFFTDSIEICLDSLKCIFFNKKRNILIKAVHVE